MDSNRFDALTRSLSEDTTRRSLTRFLAGLTLSGLSLGGLLRPLTSEAKKRGHGKDKRKKDKGHEKKDQKGKHDQQGNKGRKGNDRKKVQKSAACRPPGDPCSRKSQCCSNTCAQGTCLCARADQCPPPGSCQTRACTAAGTCTVTPAPDGTGCNGTGVCQSGLCVPSASSCVPACTGGQLCRNGNCVCDTTLSCGDSCRCPNGQVCPSGQCSCPDGTMMCDGSCVDPQIDPNHCGGCGTACASGTGTCRGGVCGTPEVCDRIDNDFDGEIDEGSPCPQNKVCQNGQCLCPEGMQDCDGDDTCEQLGTDQHCADCTPCTGGQVCQGGQCLPATPSCVPACTGVQVCQNGNCVCDPSRACGVGCPCPLGQGCFDGVCRCDPSVSCGPACECPDGLVCQGGHCFTPSVCGDGVCTGSETCRTCPEDCGSCPTCTTDADCVPSECCHPYSCVHISQAPVCGDGACDTGCSQFTMDCGQGYCACQNGTCGAVLF